MLINSFFHSSIFLFWFSAKVAECLSLRRVLVCGVYSAFEFENYTKIAGRIIFLDKLHVSPLKYVIPWLIRMNQFFSTIRENIQEICVQRNIIIIRRIVLRLCYIWIYSASAMLLPSVCNLFAILMRLKPSAILSSLAPSRFKRIHLLV